MFLESLSPSSVERNLSFSRSACSCVPLEIEWRLNFSQTCPPINVSQGSETGIMDAFCNIFGPSGNDNGLVPVIIRSVRILELNQQLQTMEDSFRQDLDLVNGDIITFTSIMATESGQIPGGLQMRLEGENFEGEEVVNDWIVSYTHRCDAEVFSPGSSLGWTVFSKLSPPRRDLCPQGPTIRPTVSSSPLAQTTLMPTDVPFVVSTNSTPSILRSTQPSRKPSGKPSMPTRLPSEAPSPRSTTPLPTPTRSFVPTEPSTFPPTERCNLSSEERRGGIYSVLIDVSEPVLLVRPSTPQYEAINWLVRDDDLYLCPDDPTLIQRYVMVVFYFSTGGPGWKICSADVSSTCDMGQHYLNPVSECEWFGSSCNEDRFVTAIEIENNNLSGEIPEEISFLSNMTLLKLEQDNIEGEIPEAIGQLTNLEVLDLDYQRMSGMIPEKIFDLTKLQLLDLNDNAFSGSISPSMGNLTQLRFLHLETNKFVGTLPQDLGNLSSLIAASFHNNRITGEIPRDVCSYRVPNGDLFSLTADCGGNLPQLECNCCTECFG